MVSDIELLYATEGEVPVAQGAQPSYGQEQPGDTPEQSGMTGQQQEALITPGEAWICNRDGQRRVGVGTEEALAKWRAVSEASCERQVRGQWRTRDA